MGRDIEQALSGVAVLVFIAAVGFIGVHCLMACKPAAQQAIVLTVENAAAVKQYDDALLDCQRTARQKPKDQRFEAYADCEQNVSKAFCESSGELRDNWVRCKELSQ